ncbi:hypothetical protein [Alcanivorax sp.]|uniref:hypothetical protein n=1 Tax=Alcanivorax sp. TaxID=1872427 RepID=UPI003A941F1A
MNFTNFLGLGEVAKHVRRLLVEIPNSRFWALMALPVVLLVIWRLPDLIQSLS